MILAHIHRALGQPKWIVAPLCAILFAPDLHAAGDGDTLTLQVAPDAVHYHYSADHTKHSWLVGLEYRWQDRWLVGYSYFNNSFGQKSDYVYGGRMWELTRDDASSWYAKVSGGIIVGYRKPYEDKIPFNHNGVAPAIIPAVGYQHDRFNAQFNVLGSAGLMVTLGYDLF
jgi:hypothetical protein